MPVIGQLTVMDISLAIAVMALGTAIQASIGFGVALIAAPVLLLLDRDLVHGPIIAAAFFLVIWMSYNERHAINYSHIKIALIGRLCGTPVGAWLIGTLSAAMFDILFSLLVMMGVAISLLHANVRATPVSVFLATAASGFMSTISSIGGPPLALVYQNSQGSELRANLSMLFMMGCMFSLTALFLVGEFGLTEIKYSGVLFSGVLLGVPLSRPLKKFLEGKKARPYLLALCFLSALGVLARALLSWAGSSI